MKKEPYCSNCMEKCIPKNDYLNPIKAISKMLVALLLVEKPEKEFSFCHNSKVIYLDIKERILIALEDEINKI